MITEYLEKIPNYIVDIKQLKNEFDLVKHLLTDAKRPNTTVLAQRLLNIMSSSTAFKEISLIPYTHSIVREILLKYNLNTVTYRCLLPDTCYSWHTDSGGNCVHIPLITNEGCRFVYEDKSFHMPADGSVYYINNGRPHSFMNGGKFPRVHITIENY
jgi:hypothetical protein